MTFDSIKNETVLKKIMEMLNVKEIIPFDEMRVVINNIINGCVIQTKDTVEIDYVIMEILKRVYILHNYTELDLSKEVENPDINMAKIADWSHCIWDKIIKKIKNYDIFQKLLDKTIEYELNKSSKIEHTISKFIDDITTKIKGFDLKTVDPKLLTLFSSALGNIKNENLKFQIPEK